MRIKLLQDVSVAPEHGMRVGREFDVIEETRGRRSGGWWVKGDTGERVLVRYHEANEMAQTTLNSNKQEE